MMNKTLPKENSSGSVFLVQVRFSAFLDWMLPYDHRQPDVLVEDEFNDSLGAFFDGANLIVIVQDNIGEIGRASCRERV